MTNEEAITILSAYITCLKCGISGKPCDVNCKTQYEAGTMGEMFVVINTAIEALKAQQTSEDATKGTTSDTVSRQAVLDAFGLSEKTRKYGGDHSGYDTRMLYEIQGVIEGVPSVEPEIIRCNDCMHYKPMSNDSEWGYCSVHGNRTCQSIDFCAWAERRGGT